MNKLCPVLLIMLLASCKPAPAPNKLQESSVCPAHVESPGAVEKIEAPAGEKPVPGDWLIRRIEAEPGTLNPLTRHG